MHEINEENYPKLVEECDKENIIVTNTPNAVRRPVAVASLTFIFALSGRLFMN